MQLLKKFDGQSFKEESLRKADGTDVTVKQKYAIKRLPKYLLLHVKRFSMNNFFKEKN